jgi:hypothetical protein
VLYRWKETVGLVTKEGVKGLMSSSPEVEREAKVIVDLPSSAKPGTTLGEVVVEMGGEQVGDTARRPHRLRRGFVVGAGVVYSRGDFRVED